MATNRFSQSSTLRTSDISSIVTTPEHERIPSALYDETVSVRPLPTGYSTKPDIRPDEYYLFPSETKRILVRWHEEMHDHPVRVADVRVGDVQRRLGGVLGIEYGRAGQRKVRWLSNGKKRLWKEWVVCEKLGGKGALEAVLLVRNK